jgi:hypothetical protein
MAQMIEHKSPKFKPQYHQKEKKWNLGSSSWLHIFVKQIHCRNILSAQVQRCQQQDQTWSEAGLEDGTAHGFVSKGSGAYIFLLHLESLFYDKANVSQQG